MRRGLAVLQRKLQNRRPAPCSSSGVQVARRRVDDREHEHEQDAGAGDRVGDAGLKSAAIAPPSRKPTPGIALASASSSDEHPRLVGGAGQLLDRGHQRDPLDPVAEPADDRGGAGDGERRRDRGAEVGDADRQRSRRPAARAAAPARSPAKTQAAERPCRRPSSPAGRRSRRRRRRASPSRTRPRSGSRARRRRTPPPGRRAGAAAPGARARRRARAAAAPSSRPRPPRPRGSRARG